MPDGCDTRPAPAPFILTASAAAVTHTCQATGTSLTFNVQRDVLINTEQTRRVGGGTPFLGGITATTATLTTRRFVEKFTAILTN
jgi:hypothetical protein